MNSGPHCVRTGDDQPATILPQLISPLEIFVPPSAHRAVIPFACAVPKSSRHDTHRRVARCCRCELTQLFATYFFALDSGRLMGVPCWLPIAASRSTLDPRALSLILAPSAYPNRLLKRGAHIRIRHNSICETAPTSRSDPASPSAKQGSPRRSGRRLTQCSSSPHDSASTMARPAADPTAGTPQ